MTKRAIYRRLHSDNAKDSSETVEPLPQTINDQQSATVRLAGRLRLADIKTLHRLQESDYPMLDQLKSDPRFGSVITDHAPEHSAPSDLAD